MELKQARKWLKYYFEKNNIEQDEVDKLLCEVLKVNYSKLFLLESISKPDFFKVKYFAYVRRKGKPLTKIFHSVYFYGKKFYINNSVLSPRQETEILVEKVLKDLKQSNGSATILDLCTGSGIIALSLKENCDAIVYASDISSGALKVARKNAKIHKQEIGFIQSNMFENINQKFDYIVSNPPYIETKVCDTLEIEVKKYDPMIALDGGDDGLDFYRVIASEGKKHLTKNGKIFMEIGYNQRKSVEQLFLSQGFDTICYKDYSNLDRVIVAIKKD